MPDPTTISIDDILQLTQTWSPMKSINLSRHLAKDVRATPDEDISKAYEIVLSWDDDKQRMFRQKRSNVLFGQGEMRGTQTGLSLLEPASAHGVTARFISGAKRNDFKLNTGTAQLKFWRSASKGKFSSVAYPDTLLKAITTGRTVGELYQSATKFGCLLWTASIELNSRPNLTDDHRELLSKAISYVCIDLARCVQAAYKAMTASNWTLDCDQLHADKATREALNQLYVSAEFLDGVTLKTIKLDKQEIGDESRFAV